MNDWECITPRGQDYISSTYLSTKPSSQQLSNNSGHTTNTKLDDESSMYSTPPRKKKTFDSSSSNLASTTSMTTVSDMSLTPQHACTVSMIESDMVSYDSFISRTSQFSSSTLTLQGGENYDTRLLHKNVELKSSILDELLKDESDFIIMVESPPSSPMKNDTPLKEGQTLEYSMSTSSISVNSNHTVSNTVNSQISGCLSPPILNKKQFSRSFNDIPSQSCEKRLFESSSPIMGESHQFTPTTTRQDKHTRRETLTPVTAAFLKQARTQRNSLARKGNFIHRLSMRKFQDFSNFQNSENSENSESAHQKIFEKMKTNQGKTINELCKEFSIVLIFVKSFLCAYSSLSIGNMNRQLTKMLSMNVMPVFVIFGEESSCENGGLCFEGSSEGNENRRNSVMFSGLKKSWRSFRKKPKESSSSSSSLDTIFGTNFTQSNFDKFSQYKQLIQGFNRVYDPTGEFFQYFNVNKLPVQSTINLSSLFSAINVTMQGFKVGITTDHVSQFKRLPALFMIHNHSVMEYKFVDMQEKPEYIEFLIDANSEECIDSEVEPISEVHYDLNTPEDLDKENKEIITIHPEKFVYSNNIQQPSNQFKELSDTFSKQYQKKGIRRTLSCFFGQNNSPTCSPRKRR